MVSGANDGYAGEGRKKNQKLKKLNLEILLKVKKRVRKNKI